MMSFSYVHISMHIACMCKHALENARTEKEQVEWSFHFIYRSRTFVCSIVAIGQVWMSALSNLISALHADKHSVKIVSCHANLITGYSLTQLYHLLYSRKQSFKMKFNSLKMNIVSWMFS